MGYKGDPFRGLELIEKCIQVTSVLDKGVGVRAALGQLFRIAHADEIGRETAAEIAYVGKNVAPEVGGVGLP